jgi:hypothetical protein
MEAESMIQPDLFDFPDGVPRDVCELFETLALRLRVRGFRRYSARAILHQIRWHHHVDRGDRGFKANNNWTPGMARWFMERHPEMDGFFELREQVMSEDEEDADARS